MPFTPNNRELVRDDAADVERRPVAALYVGLIELPQPRPVLDALVGVAVQVEENGFRGGAPQLGQMAPVETGIDAEVFVHAFDHALPVGFRAADEFR